ncbi:hypothetical protein T12_16651 [Trichinella patagoniensis]|uniref:Uncharacterized protein n=1 Tax=Trichinella patagoniensis TaxID=990121 RepID=A0A0V0ZYA7_9BILA|nr:hypothetical protein T12_16651 [Trichinella patagoniensis]
MAKRTDKIVLKRCCHIKSQKSHRSHCFLLNFIFLVPVGWLNAASKRKHLPLTKHWLTDSSYIGRSVKYEEL